jgi:hypothetical protein
MSAITLITIISLLILFEQIRSKEELQLVVEISRHGARSPGKILPLAKDPAQNY